jgi:hypothetical protein
VTELEDRIVRGFSQSITRRRLLERTMRGGLVAGAALASPMAFFTAKAQGATCGVYGFVNTWGCFCASTPTCSSGHCCDGECCGGYRKRCDYWTQADASGGYCWCSQQCCHNLNWGWYTCCDCWTGSTGSCGSANGQSKCVCKQFHCTDTCCIGVADCPVC